jgi:upstream activation factor subunit UAF30
MASTTTTTATATATESVSRSSLEEQVNELLTFVNESIVREKELKIKLTLLQKDVKKIKGHKTVSAPRKGLPSGFSKPTKLSDELCAFMGLDAGSLRPRSEVTAFLNSYIKEKNLQNPENRRHIIPDASLKKLLKVSEDKLVSYFNLQTFMAPLFVKEQV